MKYLITGGCGFLGANLAGEVLRRKEELIVFDNLTRSGSSENKAWIEKQGKFLFRHGDIRNKNDVENIVQEVKPDVIFHLAGQVAMTTSLQYPYRDFEINVIGSLNILEAVRKHCPNTIILYSSTNKVYGDLEQFDYTELDLRYTVPGLEDGFDESTPLDFRSPYGCSKGAADQYMLDYARNFELNTIVFRHSSIFGGLQFSTSDQGWIGWFIQQAILTSKGRLQEPFTISGDGKQVRDILFASDLINCYFSALDHAKQCTGHAFNIGGGMENSLSLLELFAFLEKELRIKLNYRKLPWRSNDQKVFVADINKAKKKFSWAPKVDKYSGLVKMKDWVEKITR
jgi:CDP-paratose 2-epimerase